ncbi:NKAP family protein CG6066-like [Ischnura elegans]|uniref:NKAP family protein CG6066-like n=1 Tax=Ischnura elegans TaxID=197161 RepID=UPI001ED8A992|nr:NKAP family protein CG6066-like [Ischnura elegans]
MHERSDRDRSRRRSRERDVHKRRQRDSRSDVRGEGDLSPKADRGRHRKLDTFKEERSKRCRDSSDRNSHLEYSDRVKEHDFNKYDGGKRNHDRDRTAEKKQVASTTRKRDEMDSESKHRHKKVREEESTIMGPPPPRPAPSQPIAAALLALAMSSSVPDNESKDDDGNPYRKYGTMAANLKSSNPEAFQSRNPDSEGRWPHDGWQAESNSGWRGRSNRGPSGFRRGAVSEEFMEQRRRERERISLVGVPEVWGKSPPYAPEYYENIGHEYALNGKRKDGEESSLFGEKRKKTKKEKKKKKKKEKKAKAKKSKGKKHKKVKKKKKESSSDDDSSSGSEEEEEWIEKTVVPAAQASVESGDDVRLPDGWRAKSSEQGDTDESEEDEEDVVGPVQKTQVSLTPREYGKALLPGEGAAMAAYVAEGKRIPRRGEIGLTSDQIASFECVGYVMSGSRHRRMEAVRIRKENQIYSADEKRALAMFSKEERQKRENRILSQFRDMVHSKLQQSSSGVAGGSAENE